MNGLARDFDWECVNLNIDLDAHGCKVWALLPDRIHALSFSTSKETMISIIISRDTKLRQETKDDDDNDDHIAFNSP